MRFKMKTTRSLKVRRYVPCLIDMNEYLVSFPGSTLAQKIDVTELNDIILNSMPNSLSKKVYVQGFDCESISLKKAVNIFERIKISESIYKGVL